MDLRMIWPLIPATLMLWAGCPAEDKGPPPISHPDRMTVWAEFVTRDQAPGLAAFAAANGLNLNLAVMEDLHDRDYVGAFCVEAEVNDVALTLWPLLSEAKGYWPNQANVEDFAAYVWTLVDWARDLCPRLEGIVIDLEMPIDRAREMERMFNEGGSVNDIVVFLINGIDEEAFETARERFADLVDDLQADGYRVTASTLPMVVDDYDDGDESIAMALWTPVEGIDWNGISFQIYRSLFDGVFSAGLDDPTVPFTSGLITSYSRSILTYFPERGGIDLGTTGQGIGTATPLASADELQSDIAAALAEGIPQGRINIYSLEGVMEQTDATDWVVVPAANPVPIDANTDEIRNLFAGLDAFHP